MTAQRLIDANAAFDKINKEYGEGNIINLKRVINNIPIVDAVPVVHGHWVKATGMMPPEYFGKHVCSVCDSFAPNGFNSMFEWLSKICPSCGAKMDEKDGK